MWISRVIFERQNMKLVLLVAIGSTLVFFPACIPERSVRDVVSVEWKPWGEPVLNENQLNQALEARWSLGMIRALCNSIPPTPGSDQNLVALKPSWKGVLYKHQKTGFDSIWWYAGTVSNRLDAYSLNATKGHKNWILEIAREKSLTLPPLVLSGDK